MSWHIQDVCNYTVVHQYVFATNFVKEKKYEKTEKNKRGNSDISEEEKNDVHV